MYRRLRRRVPCVHLCLRLMTAACTIAAGLAVELRADVVMPLVNPGAEFGSLTGWTNSQGYFSAVQNTSLAYQGDWFFETTNVFNDSSGIGALTQTRGFAPLVGSLSDVKVSLAIAQESGAAFDPNTNTSYDYVSFLVVRFYDVGGNPLDSGYGMGINNSATWQFTTTSFAFVGYLNQVATIKVEAYGGWRDLNTGLVGLTVPSQFVTDPPAWSRFDAVGLEIVADPPPFACDLQSPCQSAVVELIAGAVDEFSLPSDPTSPGPELLAIGTCTNSIDFDTMQLNSPICHTIGGIPANVTAAVLELRIWAGTGTLLTCNDALSLQAQSNGTFVWTRFLGTAGSGCVGGPPGLQAQPWSPNSLQTFCLDLAALPNEDGSCTNLLPFLQADGRLDIRLQDDSGVDFARLLYVVCPCTPPPPDMVAWWPLDEKTGTGAMDLTPFGNDGNHNPVVGGPKPVCGKVDGALHFDGVNDSVSVADDPSLDFGTGPFSIDFWINIEGSTGTLIEKFDPGGIGFRIWLNGGVPALDLGDGVMSCAMNLGLAPSPGTWHHIAVTVTGTGDDDTPRSGRFYFNGQQTAGPIALDCSNISNNVSLVIGAQLSTMNPFHGYLDEIEVFNRVISLAEIQAIYDADLAGKCKCLCPGDMNLDQILNGLDIAGFIRCLLGVGTAADRCKCADMNYDGLTDIDDIDDFVAALLGKVPC